MKKRRIGAALCLILMLFVCAAVGEVTNAQRVLVKEGTDAFWQMVNMQPLQVYREEGTARVCVYPAEPVSFAGKPETDYCAQNSYEIRLREVNGIGFTVTGIDRYVYEPFIDQFTRIPDYFMGEEMTLEPFGSLTLNGSEPRLGNVNLSVIAVRGVDDNGHEMEFYGVMESSNQQGIAEADEASEYDTQNLRLNADFDIAVANGVDWVPASALGGTRYTNREIAQLTQKTPEEKREAVSTLYEALQLFQISNFRNGNDNVRIGEGGYDWEHHKPGYDAVRTNEGCCATDSDWLNYILADDYDEVGFLAYSQQDGSGHIINYIRDGEDYYYIDLTHYRTDFLEASAVETGRLTDYRDSDFISGNIHKTQDPEAYAQYCRDAFNDPPAIFLQYQAEDCMPIDSRMIDGRMCIVYPETCELTVVLDDPNDSVELRYAQMPQQRPDWSALPDAVITPDARYTEEIAGQETMPEDCGRQTGDVLELVYYGEEAGFCEIDGTEYEVNTTEDFDCGIESALVTYGGCYYSDIHISFPLHEHPDLPQELQSVWIGDLIYDIPLRIGRYCVTVCEETENGLEVKEVITDRPGWLKEIYLYKDADGSWQPTPVTWWLFDYETPAGIQKHVYMRFFCDVEP